MNPRVITLISGVLILFSFFTSCKENAAKASVTPESFPVVAPVVKDTVFTKEYIAQVHSLQNVEIRTHVKGFIEKIHVDEGKPVVQGQVLFSLGSREFRENLLRATANYKSNVAELKVLEVELANTRRLADKNIVSEAEWEMVKARKEAVEARIEEAQSAIAIAQLNLSYTEVKAPFTGVINRIPYKTGSLVAEGDLLTTLSNNNSVFAYFNVSEREFLELLKKNVQGVPEEVSFQMANNELFPLKGRIETTENEIDKTSGNIAFRARFHNPSHLLRHGATGKVLVKEELKNALLIPQKATFEIQDKIYVYTVDNTNTIRIRNIIPKVRLSQWYAVESGLEPTDKVVYEGIQHLKEGTRIQPRVVTVTAVK